MNQPGDKVVINGTTFIITDMEISRDWAQDAWTMSPPSFGPIPTGATTLKLSLESVGPIDSSNTTSDIHVVDACKEPKPIKQCDIRGIDFDFVDLKL